MQHGVRTMRAAAQRVGRRALSTAALQVDMTYEDEQRRALSDLLGRARQAAEVRPESAPFLSATLEAPGLRSRSTSSSSAAAVLPPQAASVLFGASPL